MKHTKEQDQRALAWIKREFGDDAGQVRGAKKVGPANWIYREYGPNSGQYKRQVLGISKNECSRIDISDLRRIVREELEPHIKLQEQIDHGSIAAVASTASKLLGAVEAFKEKASPAVINAVMPSLGHLEKTLEAMVRSPASYVAKPKPKPVASEKLQKSIEGSEGKTK